jgi:branched-chain amino acid transport system permease protein
MYVVLVLGLNIVAGFTGLISLAHVAFFGIGAYTSAILSTKIGLPFLICFLCSILIPVLFALFIGIPSIKLKGAYFVVTTLAFTIITYVGAINWISLTRGSMGIINVPFPQVSLPYFGQIIMQSRLFFYYWGFILAFFSILFSCFFKDSRVGRACIAIKENELLAETVGINISKYKLIAFVISAAFAGIAGNFYCYYFRVVTPDIIHFYFIITFFIMLISGGIGTIWGPAFGAIIFTFIPEYLRVMSYLRDSIFGLLLIILVIFLPEGIGGKINEYYYKKRIKKEKE